MLNSGDFPEEFFTLFKVIATSSMPSEDSPVRLFGISTWHLELEVPLSTKSISFEIIPRKAGRHVMEMDVCNAIEECGLVVKAIEVR